MNRITAVIGLALLIGPWVVSIAAAVQSYDLLTKTASDVEIATETTDRLKSGLSLYVLAGAAAMCGVILLAICVDGMQYRPRWLWWTMLAVGLIWIPLLPVGTMLGVALLIYTAMNTRRFRSVSAKSSPIGE